MVEVNYLDNLKRRTEYNLFYSPTKDLITQKVINVA